MADFESRFSTSKCKVMAQKITQRKNMPNKAIKDKTEEEEHTR